MIGGVLNINGKPVPKERIDDWIEEEPNGRKLRIPRYKETLPNGVVYETLDLEENTFSDNTQEYKVPDGHYFMMGDNRDNSTDSRFGSVGYVPFENFVGRAEIIFFSVEEGSHAWAIWQWPWSVRWSRIFNLL
jgi:signal peptidase I